MFLLFFINKWLQLLTSECRRGGGVGWRTALKQPPANPVALTRTEIKTHTRDPHRDKCHKKPDTPVHEQSSTSSFRPKHGYLSRSNCGSWERHIPESCKLILDFLGRLRFMLGNASLKNTTFVFLKVLLKINFKVFFFTWVNVCLLFSKFI